MPGSRFALLRLPPKSGSSCYAAPREILRLGALFSLVSLVWLIWECGAFVLDSWERWWG